MNPLPGLQPHTKGEPPGLAPRRLPRCWRWSYAGTGVPPAGRTQNLCCVSGPELTATTWGTLALLRPGDWRLAAADPRWTGGGLGLQDASEALVWLGAERANLVAAIPQTSALAPVIPAELACQLTQALFGFFFIRGYWQDGLQANHTALELARRIGDRPPGPRPQQSRCFPPAGGGSTRRRSPASRAASPSAGSWATAAGRPRRCGILAMRCGRPAATRRQKRAGERP